MPKKIKKIIVSDNNKKSLMIKLQVYRILKKRDFKKNIIIVIGGDGFMLKTLKKNKHSPKYFYGINSGDYGFLMNKFSSKKIINNINKANLITISPLEMRVTNKQGSTKKYLAINEVSILRQSRQAASLLIKVGSKIIMKRQRRTTVDTRMLN